MVEGLILIRKVLVTVSLSVQHPTTVIPSHVKLLLCKPWTPLAMLYLQVI